MRDHPRMAMVALTISSMAIVLLSKDGAAQDSVDVLGAGKALELLVGISAQMAYCAAHPSKTSIEAGEAEAESQRINPNAKRDANTIFGPAFVGVVINLGRDRAWVEAPCDRYFFPQSGR